MQEEVTQRTIALCVEATKLSAGMLQQAMKKVLDEICLLYTSSADDVTKLVHKAASSIQQNAHTNAKEGR